MRSAWELEGCQRSHPHEDMDSSCQRYSDYERRLADQRSHISILRGMLLTIKTKAQNEGLMGLLEIVAICDKEIPG